MKIKVRNICVTAILGAVGFVLMLLEFPLPMLIPSFIKFDFSELPALIASFCFGPLSGVGVCLIKNLLHLFVTTSSGVGELSNFILGAVFSLVCGIVYKKYHTRKGALIAAVSGAAAMAVLSVVTNYFLVYPAYTVIFGMPREAIVAAYKAILPVSDTLLKSLIIFNLPFTLLKGIIDSAVCFAVYKKITPLLRKSG